MPENKRMEIPFTIKLSDTHRLGKLSPSQEAKMIANKCAFMCNSLFWLLGKFSDMAWNSDLKLGDGIEPEELLFSILYVGELGQALSQTCYRSIDDISRLEDEESK